MSDSRRTMDGCGVCCFRPKWLQQFANSRWFMMVYGLLGTVQAMGYLYFVVTLTTIEKRFKIPSQTTGIILSGNEVSQIMLALILSYAGGQRNRPKWIAWGVVFCSLSCFILAAPHFIYGAGDESLELTQEYLAKHYMNATTSTMESTHEKRNKNLCLSVSADNAEQCDEVFSYLPLILIFLSQFVLGIGNTLYYSLGQSYLDDNIRHQNSPLVLAYAMALRMFGPVLGFLLGFAALNIYIEPSLTPIITKKDPRWLGAWWLGWVVLGGLMLIFSIFIGMFPKQLPKRKQSTIDAAEHERKEFIDHKNNPKPIKVEEANLKNFPIALMRLLKNKLLMFNLVSSVFYILGSNGYMTYLTKYIEVQFQRNSSDATVFTGPITILGMTVGFLVSGYVISKYKPSPRKLFFWNVVVGIFYVLGQFSYMHLSCDGTNSLTVNDTWTIPTECNAHCTCDSVAYSPVCHVATRQTFFSACHAGCQTYDDKNKTYSKCSCGTYRPFGNVNRTMERTLHTQTFPANELDMETSTEKVLIFRPINQSVEFSTAQYDAIDVTKFAELERNSSIENAKDEEYDVLYDDSREESFKNQNQSKHHLSRERRSIAVNDDLVTPGVCAGNCATAYFAFTVISLFINLLGSTGRIGNILLNFRAVAQKDKAFSQGLALTMISLLALIPGPIIFGRIIDSTCKIWSEKCGERGNCQLYDQDQFRYYVNLTALCLTSIGVFFDVLVWYYGKNLDLYGPDEETKKIDCDKDDCIKEKSSI